MASDVVGVGVGGGGGGGGRAYVQGLVCVIGSDIYDLDCDGIGCD
jgi:hypothetical protein